MNHFSSYQPTTTMNGMFFSFIWLKCILMFTYVLLLLYFIFLGNLDDLVIEDNLNFSVDRENESPILNNPLSSSLQASGKSNL